MAADNTQPSGGEILIADNIIASLKLLTGILEMAGYRVRPARGGNLALKSIQARRPDLVILDIRMPGMDGYEVCRRLKADEATRDIPVIFITAINDAIDKVRAFGIGAVDFITKPYEQHEVLARVRTHIDLCGIRKNLEKRVAQRTAELEKEIAEHKKTMAALQKSEERFRLIAETIQDVFYMRSPGIGKMIYISPAYEKIWGRSRESLYQSPRSFIDAVHPEDQDKVNSEIDKHKDGTWQPMQYRILQPDGSIRWIYDRSFPITDETGTIQYLVGVAMDITQQKLTEEALRHSYKMKAIGTLSGGIAHDFNNILGIILGNAELAIDGLPTWNPERNHLEEIKIASLRAKDVVRQLLSFARKTERMKKHLSLQSIIDGSLKLIRSSIPASIEIRHKFTETPLPILADPSEINQIMINLCTNAAQAMADGGILDIILERVEISEKDMEQHPHVPAGRYAKLIFSDTGEGISSEHMAHIFDPYFTTRDVGKGAGMGLAIVHGIVLNHGGVITARSQIGKGTTFDILLPESDPAPVHKPTMDGEMPRGAERILLVDDEPAIVKIGHHRLERLGYHVKGETDAEAALNLFREAPDQFDLVITDLTMPKMTGEQLTQAIHEVRPDVPIILCTGFSEKTNPETAESLGIAAYLEKPHDSHDLAMTVRKTLDNKYTDPTLSGSIGQPV